MNNERVGAFRAVYLTISLIALIILGVYIISEGSMAGYNEEMVDVNRLYTVKGYVENIEEVDINYCLVEGMENTKVQDKINNELINLKDSYIVAAKNNVLKDIKYKVTYIEEDMLSVIFSGSMIMNQKEIETRKSFIFNIQNGDIMKAYDFIDDSVFNSKYFKEKVKQKMNGASTKEINLDKNYNMYLEKTLSGIDYVFYFLESADDTKYTFVAISKSEILEIVDKIKQDNIKENEEIKDTNNELTDDDTKYEKPEEDNSYKIKILEPDKKGQSFTDDMIIAGDLEIKLDNKIYLADSRIIVPLEDIAKAKGYEIVKENDSIRVKKGTLVATLYINDDKYSYNDSENIKLDVTPVLKEGTTYVPIEFFSEIAMEDITVKDNTIYFN